LGTERSHIGRATAIGTANAAAPASGYEPDTLHVLTFGEPSAELLTRSHEILRLSFIQTFLIEKRVLIGGFKVKTRSYMYSIEDESYREVIAFHWHPETPGAVRFPHLHICQGAGKEIRQDVRDVHFRTDRIAFEDFALMLIRDFRVVSERDDAIDVLEANLKKFQEHKSW